MRFLLLTIAILLLAGCSDTSTKPPASPGANQANKSGASQDSAKTDEVPVPIENGVVSIGPENSQILFIGRHEGANPDPNERKGGFEKFQGAIEVDPASKTIKSISVEVDTASIWTQQGQQLTTHLKGGDFFAVDDHPVIKFQSTKVDRGAANLQGMFNISGDLTMLGTTGEVNFVTHVKATEEGLLVKGSIEFDRTKFGMDKLTDKVQPMVEISFSVGQKTQPKTQPTTAAATTPKPKTP
jgi:polyisoprenoid-binding protein YceI